jgi:hypothetical protein
MTISTDHAVSEVACGEPDAWARALDDGFLAVVADWSRGGAGCDEQSFDAMARTTFAYQLAHNEPYARFVVSLGSQAALLPPTWRDIPAVPAGAFKDATLATFDVGCAELEFHTSGTTADRTGRHYIERAALYDAALLAAFDRFVLPDRPRLRFLNLVPNPRERPHSSLGYMVGNVGVLRGDGKAAYFLRDDGVDAAGFARALETAVAQRQPVCITGTAFALVALLDAFSATGTALRAPAGSRIMETGGFKGRARVVERTELYARLEAALGIMQHDIIAEYGMTELVSQYYDAPQSRGDAERVKVGPPWLRTLVLGDDGREVAPGVTGYLRHIDLGNRSSVVAIDTEDRGYRSGDGIVLLGRAAEAPPRGCSLDAEDF